MSGEGPDQEAGAGGRNSDSPQGGLLLPLQAPSAGVTTAHHDAQDPFTLGGAAGTVDYDPRTEPQRSRHRFRRRHCWVEIPHALKQRYQQGIVEARAQHLQAQHCSDTTFQWQVHGDSPTKLAGDEAAFRWRQSPGNYQTTLANDDDNACQVQRAASDSSPTLKSRQATAGSLAAEKTLPLPDWFPPDNMPNLAQATAFLPFSDYSRDFRIERCDGFIKLDGVPNDATKKEVTAVMHKKTRLVRMPKGSPYFDVHIIMNRNTGRSTCAFVVVRNLTEASQIVLGLKYQASCDGLKVGASQVTAELSNLKELMSALFPFTKNVDWSGGTPRVLESNTDGNVEFAGNKFSGFIGSEELDWMIRAATNPAGSSIVQGVPQRPYETMISILHKFPWHTPQYITLNSRDRLFNTVQVLMHALTAAVHRNDQNYPGLTIDLLQEYVATSLTCRGFSERQKASLVDILADTGYDYLTTDPSLNIALDGIGPLSANWPFLALNPKTSVDDELLTFYAALIAEAAGCYPGLSSPHEIPDEDIIDHPFGNVEIDYNTDNLATSTLAEVASSERHTIEQVLRHELAGGFSQPHELEASRGSLQKRRSTRTLDFVFSPRTPPH